MINVGSCGAIYNTEIDFKIGSAIYSHECPIFIDRKIIIPVYKEYIEGKYIVEKKLNFIAD